MKRRVSKQIKGLQLGDLVRVEWFDASVGKSLSSRGNIDVPVQSWGVYLGVLGEKTKHIILAVNSFKYMNGLYDVDYTAIPVGWISAITLVNKNALSPLEAQNLLNSFLQGRSRTLKRRKCNH